MAGQRSGAVVIPPPVMGWNTIDPISNMDPQYAPALDNFFPAMGTVDLRNGRTRFATPTLGAALHTFKYGWYDKLILANGLIGLTDISSGGAGTSILGAVVTNAGFIYSQQFRDRLFLTTISTSDDCYYWTGTGNITAAAFTGPSGDDKDLGVMTVYKSRLYFGQITAASIWYGGVDSVTGALTEFPVQSIFKIGGKVAFIGSVTRAKDFSEDELFAIISTEGEILIYQGDYPEDPNWSLIGHYFIPTPLSAKAFFYLGSTLMIITSQGILPIDTIMGGTFSGLSSSIMTGDISRVIRNQFTEAAKIIGPLNDDSGFPRWSGCNYPRGNFIIINVPTTLSSGGGTNLSVQFVMNTLTGAWCRFTGWPANAFAVWQDRLYMTWAGAVGSGGTGSAVWLCDDGYTDYDSSNAIQTRTIKLRHAFNYLGNNIANKVFTQAIPTIYQSEGLSLTLDCDVDYTDVIATSTETDTTDTAYKLYQPRMGLTNQVNGSAVSIRIDGEVTTKRMSLQATKVYWLEGGID